MVIFLAICECHIIIILIVRFLHDLCMLFLLISRGGVGTTGAMNHMFYAEVTDEMKVGPGGGLVDEGELIEVVEYSIDDARKLLTDESINKVHSFLFALYWFFDQILPTIKR